MTSLFLLQQDLFLQRRSSVELCTEYIHRIERENPALHAFITLNSERALSVASEVDSARIKGEPLSPLAGIPYALKDNFCTKNLRTTCASKMLEDFIPPYDAHVVSLLKEAKLPLLGKLSMDEFAMGSTGETSFFGACKNPLFPDCVPGGSSSGAAAAVAAGLTPFALGTDTGGSVRTPAAFCGVTALKPTYGLVSRRGLIAYASSLDTIGPVANSVTDCALVLEQIAGKDPLDATSQNRASSSLPEALSSLRGKRIALLLPDDVPTDPEIAAAVLRAAKLASDAGAAVEPLSFRDFSSSLAAYYVIACAEASSNLARYDGVKYGYSAKDASTPAELFRRSRSEGFGREVKRRILMGTFVLSAGYYEEYYARARANRRSLCKSYARIFSRYDVILSPVTPHLPPKAGTKTETLYEEDIYTVPPSLAGLPALSLPFGRSKAGLPLAVQLTSPAFSEKLLCEIGLFLEGGAEN